MTYLENADSARIELRALLSEIYQTEDVRTRHLATVRAVKAAVGDVRVMVLLDELGYVKSYTAFDVQASLEPVRYVATAARVGLADVVHLLARLEGAIERSGDGSAGS